MDDASVRPATTDDVADVHRVARESWHAVYDGILGAETVESVVSDWYAPDGLRRSVERADGAFLVAERDAGDVDADDADAVAGETETGSEVVGFAQCVLDDEDAVAELARIYVHPDRWNEGVGSALLDRVEAWASDRGAERLRLVVLADNEVGNAFYEGRGYRRIDSRESEIAGESYADYLREREL